MLTQALRISPSEANRRVRAAEQLGERVSQTGQPLAPVRPSLAAAQRDGAVTPEQAAVVLTGLAKVDRVGYDPAEVAAGERELTDLARVFGPKDLQVCVDRFVDCLDPDGSKPEDELVEDRRYVSLTRRRDGGWDGELHLTGALGAKRQAVLSTLAKPRANPVVDDRTRGRTANACTTRWRTCATGAARRPTRQWRDPGEGGRHGRRGQLAVPDGSRHHQ